MNVETLEKTGADFSHEALMAVWVLEVQVRHPTKPIGGFYEDLLLEDKDYA